MPKYRCKIIDEVGTKETLIEEASDVISLRGNLRARGIILENAEIIKEKEINVFFSVSSKVKRSEVVLFLRQFSVLINSSISISDSLYTLRAQNYTPAFKKVISDIYKDVYSGVLLSDAFAKHPKVFPSFFNEMIAIGEVSGSLDTVLRELADYYENDQKIKGKAKSAMAYPTILLVMIFAVCLFMCFVILPEFEDMFKSFGGDVPRITEIIMNIAAFVRDYIGFIFLGLVFVGFIIYLFFKSKAGKIAKDFIAIRFPIIGKINHAIITSRFTKAFVILLKSGMNITDCMDNLKRLLDNAFFSKKFEFAIIEVRRGKPIAKSIENTQMFPSILTEMINIGEKSGNLEEVLSSTTSFYDDEVERKITRATSLLEPIMLLFLGAIVAVVLLSVYLPMIQLMDQI